MTAESGGVRIVGIDPGSRVTGYGVIDFYNHRSVHVGSGNIGVPAAELAAKLDTIFSRLGEIIDRFHPQELAIERVFVHRNADSALKLGQARGAAVLAAVTRGLSIHEYTPNQIKQAVTGRGHAEKAQVQHMVRVLLCLAEPPPADAADALATAICHGHVRQTRARTERALQKAAQHP